MEPQEQPKLHFYFYVITNKVNGKKYIGQTRSKINARFNKHKHVARVGGNTRFYAAIRKHGEENFEVSLLREGDMTQSEADQVEITLISVFNTTDPEVGYNMTTGGNTKDNVKLSPEACEKISKAKIGKPLTVRRLRTQKEDEPIVEAFKAGKSRSQICAELGFSTAKIQKALARWKERVDPTLQVGAEFQHEQAGMSLRKRADELNQPIIDDLLAGLSRKDVAAKHGVDYGRVKQVILRYRDRLAEEGKELPEIMRNRNNTVSEETDRKHAPIIELHLTGVRNRDIERQLGLDHELVKGAIHRFRKKSKK